MVVDTSVKHAYAAQPGQQEWVMVIECISASRSKIPPYVIFKGEHLVSTWLPATLPPDWTFAVNSKGWTNDFHGIHWIKHFNTHTKPLLTSPEDYLVLLCDGHGSHISAAFISYSLQNRIDIILLPPHSSHLLQPLDVAIFGPLKSALANRQSRLFRSGIRRIEKIAWLEHFMEAREEAIHEKNILAG